jgi:lipoprotein signal peptidase
LESEKLVDDKASQRHTAHGSIFAEANGIGARLRRLGRSWRLGIHLDKGRPAKLAVVIASLTFISTYSAGALARAYAPPMGPRSAWLAFGLVENGRALLSGGAGLLLGALTVIFVVGYVPLATAQLRWWTRRRQALLIAFALVVGSVACNLLEGLQKGSVTDFLVVGDGDFNAGDIVMIVGIASLLVLRLAPDHVAVTKGHIAVALGAAGISLIALPLVRAPLNHLPFLVALLASLTWLVGYVVWRMRIGSQLLATLSRDAQASASLETDLLIRDWELALSRNLHRDLAASGRALAKLAGAYTRLGRRDDLRRIADAYLSVADAVDNHRMKAWALHHLGSYWVLEGDLKEADRVWRQALQMAEQESDDRHTVRLLGNIAWAEAQMDNPVDSQRMYRTAINLAEHLGDADLASRLKHDANS